MNKTPPLNALKIFYFTSDYQSFSEAAEVLCMTKGAISQQIKLLEQWFGFSLFDRKRDGVTLNKDGRKVRNLCDNYFNPLVTMCNDLKYSSQTPLVTKIGCSSSLLSSWLIPNIEKVPTSDCYKFDYISTASFSDLLQGNIDIFISGKIDNLPDGVESYLLFQDIIGLVCSNDYVKYLDKDQITLINSTSRNSAWDEWSKISNVSLNINKVIQFDKLILALDAVKQNLGVAIAPRFVVRQNIEKGFLVAPFGFVTSSCGTYLYTSATASDRTKYIARNFLTKFTE